MMASRQLLAEQTFLARVAGGGGAGTTGARAADHAQYLQLGQRAEGGPHLLLSQMWGSGAGSGKSPHLAAEEQ